MLILVFIFLNVPLLLGFYIAAFRNLIKAAGLQNERVKHENQDVRRQNENVQKEQWQIALSLGFYPAVYMILTMTLAISRILNMAGMNLNPVVYFIGESLYSCEGWCNVLLYTTREGVIPWTWTRWRNDLLALMEAYHPKRD